MAKYVLSRNNSQYHFTLQADNGEKVLSSETYWSHDGALNGIASVRLNSQIDSRYDRRTSSRGQPYFVLRAANNEVIGTSEEYSSTAARDAGIALIKRIAPTAPVVDLTLTPARSF